MSEQEQNKPFVINDRRKFRMDGEPIEPRPEEPASSEPVAITPEPPMTPAESAAPVSAAASPAPESRSGPIPFPSREERGDTLQTNSAHTITPVPEAADAFVEEEPSDEAKLPPPPTPEEMEQVRTAYEATAERLDTMMRSQNLGGEQLPPMDFNQLVQSIYMSAMIQLGAGTQQGQQARVDLLGAKQSIDMLSVIEEKTGGSLTEQEGRLLESALFELRMGFLEITQLLARQAQARQTTPPPPGTPTGGGFSGGGGAGFGGSGFTGGGPRIVR